MVVVYTPTGLVMGRGRKCIRQARGAVFRPAGEAAGGRSTPRVWLVEACADILETRAADMSVSVADRKNARQGAVGLRSGSLPLETVLADIGYTTEQVG